MKIRFFRLENDDGVGVYHSADDSGLSIWQKVTESKESSLQHDAIHVQPVVDYELRLTFEELTRCQYHFGFLSIDQYKAWLYNPLWRKNLSNHGISLSIYEIEEGDLKKSSHQVAFLRNDATLVEKVNPFHFF